MVVLFQNKTDRHQTNYCHSPWSLSLSHSLNPLALSHSPYLTLSHSQTFIQPQSVKNTPWRYGKWKLQLINLSSATWWNIKKYFFIFYQDRFIQKLCSSDGNPTVCIRWLWALSDRFDLSECKNMSSRLQASIRYAAVSRHLDKVLMAAAKIFVFQTLNQK